MKHVSSGAYDFRKAGKTGKDAPKTVSDVHIKRHDNGGHTVETMYHHPDMGGIYHKPESASFGPGDHRKMRKHVDEQLNLKGKGEEKEGLSNQEALEEAQEAPTHGH